jgi:hypothetical protein
MLDELERDKNDLDQKMKEMDEFFGCLDISNIKEFEIRAKSVFEEWNDFMKNSIEKIVNDHKG